MEWLPIDDYWLWIPIAWLVIVIPIGIILSKLAASEGGFINEENNKENDE